MNATAEACIVDQSAGVEDVVGRIAGQGSVLCRGAFDPSKLFFYRDNAERFFGFVEFKLLHKQDIPELVPYNCTTSRMGANIFCLNARIKPLQWPFLNQIKESYVFPILQAHLKSERLLFLFHSSRVRKVYPDVHPLGKVVNSRFPFHQDANPVGNSTASVALWIPLGPCGREAPSIEVALKPMARVLPLANEADSPFKDFAQIESEIEAELGDAPLLHGDYELGDLQILPSTTFYRTAIDEGMHSPGLFAELRFVAESEHQAFPQEKKPIFL